MKFPANKKSDNIVKGFFLLLFIYVCVQTNMLVANANEITLDNSDDAFSGRIFWPEFMQNCGDDNYLDTGGELHDIQAEIIFNVETGKITGTVSANQIDERFPSTYKEDSFVQGTINGVMERKNDYGTANYWQWVFTGEIDLTIRYHMEHKCNDDTGEYWETEDQTLTKKGVLSGGTWGDTWTLDLRWEDQETRDGRTRFVQLSPDYTISQFVFPKPIDLDVSISVASDVNYDSDSDPFTLTVEGRDVNMIDHFGWYFAYWEPDLELYWGLQNEQRFETSGKDSLQVTDAMRAEWRRLAGEYGVEVADGSEIDLQLNLRTFDENGYDLIENLSFEYTYSAISGASSGSTSEDTSSPNTIIPSPEAEPSSFLGGMTGTLLTMGGVALGGYGLFRMLKKPGAKSVTRIESSSEKNEGFDDSIKLSAGSEIQTEIAKDPTGASPSLESGMLNGSLDSTNLSLDGGKSKLSLEQGTRVDDDLELLSNKDTINLQDKTLKVEGKVESQESTMDSVELDLGSQLETNIDVLQVEPNSNITPNSIDGSIESGSLSEDNSKMNIDSGSRIQVEVNSVASTEPDIIEETGLRLEGDVSTKASKSEVNGNIRSNIGIQFNGSDSFAASSDSQIDIEKAPKSDVKKNDGKTKDNELSKTDVSNSEG